MRRHSFDFVEELVRAPRQSASEIRGCQNLSGSDILGVDSDAGVQLRQFRIGIQQFPPQFFGLAGNPLLGFVHVPNVVGKRECSFVR